EREEAQDACKRHADWCVALARESQPNLRGANQLQWLERLEAEHDNLRAALEWSGEEGRTEQELRLAGSLWQFWTIRGHLTEGRERLSRALARPSAGDPAVRARAMNN